jgi:hypothetical protein
MPLNSFISFILETGLKAPTNRGISAGMRLQIPPIGERQLKNKNEYRTL